MLLSSPEKDFLLVFGLIFLFKKEKKDSFHPFVKGLPGLPGQKDCLLCDSLLQKVLFYWYLG